MHTCGERVPVVSYSACVVRDACCRVVSPCDVTRWCACAARSVGSRDRSVFLGLTDALVGGTCTEQRPRLAARTVVGGRDSRGMQKFELCPQ